MNHISVEAAQNHRLFVQLSLFEDPSDRTIVMCCRCTDTCVLKRWRVLKLLILVSMNKA